jgi:hypothetical protein
MEAVQGNAPGALNSSSATTSAMPSTSWGNAPRTIALKQWIKHTASSPDYLETALKIATSLTDQLIQADKLARYGISEKLDMLSTQSGPKWADHVVIRLKHAPLFEPGGVLLTGGYNMKTLARSWNVFGSPLNEGERNRNNSSVWVLWIIICLRCHFLHQGLSMIVLLSQKIVTISTWTSLKFVALRVLGARHLATKGGILRFKECII